MKYVGIFTWLKIFSFIQQRHFPYNFCLHHNLNICTEEFRRIEKGRKVKALKKFACVKSQCFEHETSCQYSDWSSFCWLMRFIAESDNDQYSFSNSKYTALVLWSTAIFYWADWLIELFLKPLWKNGIFHLIPYWLNSWHTEKCFLIVWHYLFRSSRDFFKDLSHKSKSWKTNSYFHSKNLQKRKHKNERFYAMSTWKWHFLWSSPVDCSRSIPDQIMNDI